MQNKKENQRKDSYGIYKRANGCKAGLTVLHRGNAAVALVECGHNAISAIIRFCKEGIIYSYFPDIPYICYAEPDEKADIEVRFDDTIFTDLRELNEYISWM